MLDVQYISLDISKRPTPQQVRLGQGDANGTQLVVSIFDGGSAYSLANYSVRLALRLPGSSDAYYEVNGTKSGNVATFNIDETYAASSYGADGFGYVDVMNGSTVICSTSRFQLVVLRSAEDGADPSTSYTSGIIEATQAANAAAASATSAAGSATTAAANADAKAGLADSAATAANSAASTATTAASTASSNAAAAASAASQANSAATTANSAAEAANDATEDTEAATAAALAAIEAMGDISELAVPEMSAAIRGGAKLGVGLDVSDGRLNIDLSDSGSGASVLTNGCALLDVEGDGWAEQDTTTGKNLLDTSKAISKIGNGTITGDLASGFTIDNGASGNTSARIASLPYEVGQTYTLSFDAVASGTFSLYIDFGDQNQAGTAIGNPYISVSAGARRYSYTGVYGEATSYKHLDIGIGAANSSITITNIQLEAGSTATSYEPYTGGKPSPSPDYPQEIRVAKGRNLLIPVTSGNRTNSGITWTYNADGSLTANGTATGNSWSYSTSSQPVAHLLAGTYTASVSQGFGVRVGKFSDGSSIGQNLSGNTYTFTLSADMDVTLYAVALNGSTYANKNCVLQIESGSTATPYVPYGHVGLEIQGFNLWDEQWEVGSIDANTGQNVSATGRIRSTNYIPVAPSTTYYLIVPIGTFPVFFYDENKNYITPSFGDVTGLFTTPANARYMRFRTGSNYGGTYNNNICLNVSNLERNGEYEPYYHATIPVPIPSDGSAALSGGTHDTLAIDSAGHVVADKKITLFEFLGSSVTWTQSGNNVSCPRPSACPTWLPWTGSMSNVNGISNISSNANSMIFRSTDGSALDVSTWSAAVANVTIQVLAYKAGVTEQTIDLGYIDLPLMPDGCTVSIPELHEIGVEWLVTGADGVSEMALDERGRTLHEIALAGDAELSNVAPIENGKASTNYAVGSYLVHGGTLYRVTTAIATGETITPGSNVTATTVMAELIRLTA